MKISADTHSSFRPPAEDALLERLRVALAGRYDLQRTAGRGAMASVYAARDLVQQRDVAIKALRIASNADASERFMREVKYLSQLQHAHILPLYDSGDALGILYFVTAFVDGDTLRQRIDAAPARQLPIGRVVQWTGEIAGALDHAHQHNILHRDIKPENVLVGDNHALVADFGIARVIRAVGGEGLLTSTGVAIGTPAYMSPEQLAADRQLDGRSDVYSLAIVAYEMLAGVLPFSNEHGIVDNTQKFVGAPAPLSVKRFGVSMQTERAVARALNSDPAHRFASAGEFAAALGRGT